MNLKLNHIYKHQDGTLFKYVGDHGPWAKFRSLISTVTMYVPANYLKYYNEVTEVETVTWN